MKKIFKVGLMLDPSIGYERGIARGIAKYSNHHGPWSFYSIPGKTRESLPHWPKWEDIDGVFITDRYNVKTIHEKGIPCVSVLIRKEIEGVPNVIPNDEEIGQLGSRYFLEKGYKNFAFCGEEGIAWAEKRYQSFHKAITDHGATLSKFTVHDDKVAISERQELIEAIKALPKPLAVLATNDRSGRQMVDICRQAEVLVPEEVSILGVDNDTFICELSNPPLSSIMLGVENVGYEAAKRLHMMMTQGDGCDDDSNILVPPVRIVQRQSTSLLAVEDETLAEALRFINLNADRLIQVKDVVRHTGISTSVLQRKFQRTLGRSVYAEIRRNHVDYIAKLLLETNLTVSEIAFSMGYSCDNHMSRLFKKVKGVTISEYRRKYGSGI